VATVCHADLARGVKPRLHVFPHVRNRNSAVTCVISFGMFLCGIKPKNLCINLSCARHEDVWGVERHRSSHSKTPHIKKARLLSNLP
jgi:hypothetical protein